MFSTLVQAASGYTVPKICGKQKKGADSLELLSSALSHPEERGCLPRSELFAGRSGCVGQDGQRAGGQRGCRRVSEHRGCGLRGHWAPLCANTSVWLQASLHASVQTGTAGSDVAFP